MLISYRVALLLPLFCFSACQIFKPAEWNLNVSESEDEVDETGNHGALLFQPEIHEQHPEVYPEKSLDERSMVAGLPYIHNAAVEEWLRFFRGYGKKTLGQWLHRGSAHKDLITSVLKADGMPTALYYLALVESGFVHHAASPRNACGPWQFMPGTARLYHLRMNEWVDERRDPVKSTQAAARLLRHLYEDFDDWYLAMAAYNAGPERIRKAIQKAGTRDFWVLASRPGLLSKETRDFVPKILAVMQIGENSEFYGYDLHSIKQAPAHHSFTSISLSRSVDLSELERSANLSPGSLKTWNPELKRSQTPPAAALQGSPYRLRVKDANAESIRLALHQLPTAPAKSTSTDPERALAKVRMHRIRQGDTIAALAKKYKVSAREIFKVNPDLRAQRLKIGRAITIPALKAETTR